jgi:ABC-type phosphate transport system substrate-binding protein
MRGLTFVLAATMALGGLAAGGVGSDDVAIIVNKSNPVVGLSMTQVRKIVLAEDLKWPGGGRITVWMTTPGLPERARTLKVVCGMSETDYTLHFMHASFNGEAGDPPRTAGSSAQVRQAIASGANSVGFIRASEVNDTVKVIALDGVLPGQPGYKLAQK